MRGSSRTVSTGTRLYISGEFREAIISVCGNIARSPLNKWWCYSTHSTHGYDAYVFYVSLASFPGLLQRGERTWYTPFMHSCNYYTVKSHDS